MQTNIYYQKVRRGLSKAKLYCLCQVNTRRAKQGMGTLEVVIIIAALLTLALFFSTEIKSFANKISDAAFKETSILSELGKGVG